MQTFLPYPSFEKAASCLDDKRLFKQAVEARQLVKELTGEVKTRWRNHPAVRMWRGFVPCLKSYYNAVLIEVIRRKKWRLGILRQYDMIASGEVVEAVTRRPHWIGSERFHSAHRSNLLRKDAKHYGQFGWTEHPNLAYVWPKSGEDKCLPTPKAKQPPAVGKRLF